ncbi:glyoxylase-like metal-dependent hydrolase (beta-lactamase superfamily II) [Kibdelosporangium banguiense]|uniref:Glyoxylase-like metal-dependent hydrolase (Beta-lactamase superfamily II) n=1 Tax=Kibdelosporangium banguiense TaxID=1365924 RepID=A0ABS4TNT6_9PSEU|nr:MBL fold metallo-hydrolase [Kibdelosporangium banguiense]MBP2326065.1 glyoxylase-like metal-dependent hydrolase (beta-lactamase superfamily II) [Kibdelosporangium banguiense]
MSLDRGKWATGGPETVAPGVHRIPLPLPNDGLRAVNVYVLERDTGLVLVDAGWAIPESLAVLNNALNDLGHSAADITDILVTHIHRDHYTQAAELRRLAGAKVHLGAGEQPGLKLLDTLRTDIPVSSLEILRRGGASDLADRIENSYGEFDPTGWELPDQWLQAGPTPFGLEVIPTPGHTKGHVVFLDRTRGLLFSGDHVLPHITPSIGFELGEPGLPLGDYLESLHLITTFPDTRLLPAHGQTTPSAHTRVTELLAHHDTRLAEAEATLSPNPVDAHTVATHLPWTRRAVKFENLNDFNQMLAINETMAHLDVLVARGRATTSKKNGVVKYSLA